MSLTSDSELLRCIDGLGITLCLELWPLVVTDRRIVRPQTEDELNFLLTDFGGRGRL